MTDEQKELLRDWKRLVNMSGSDVQRFLDSPLGKRAGLSRGEASKEGVKSGRDSARAIVRMKKRSPSSWTSADWKWAKRQVAFIRRMKGNKGPLMKDGRPTRKLGSLLLWGHKPSGVQLSKVLNADAYARNPEKLAEGDPKAVDSAASMYRYTRPPDWSFAIVRADGQLDTRTGGRSEAVEIAYEQSMKTKIPHLVLRAERDPRRVGHAEWVVWNFDGPENVPAESALPHVTDPSYFLDWAERGEGEKGMTVPLPKSLRRNGDIYYVWLLKKGSTEPMTTEGPYGPFDLKAAKTYARISATEGEHDRVVTRGWNPDKPRFEVIRRYKAGTGMRANSDGVLSGELTQRHRYEERWVEPYEFLSRPFSSEATAERELVRGDYPRDAYVLYVPESRMDDEHWVIVRDR